MCVQSVSPIMVLFTTAEVSLPATGRDRGRDTDRELRTTWRQLYQDNKPKKKSILGNSFFFFLRPCTYIHCEKTRHTLLRAHVLPVVPHTPHKSTLQTDRRTNFTRINRMDTNQIRRKRVHSSKVSIEEMFESVNKGHIGMLRAHDIY